MVGLSNALADAVEKAGRSVVRVDDGTRLTASGIVWSADGVIVATSHGVEADEGVEIEIADGTRHPATVVARDEDTDLAVLRVSANGLVPFERTSQSSIGQVVLALGRPGRAGLQATLGIVGSKTSVRNGEGALLNTDATFYPGFSGGALIDAGGNLLGLLNLMHGRGRGGALNVPLLEDSIAQILEHGQVRRGYLGISSQPVALSEALAQRLGLEPGTGLLISLVEKGSAAESGGLLVGDIIVRFDGRPLAEPLDLRRRLRGTEPGQSVTLSIARGGQLVETQVVVGAA